MYSWVQVSHLIQWTGALLKGDPLVNDQIVRSISSDSRSIKPGEVFVALKGENFDGHDYIEAVAKQAAPLAILCEQPRTLPHGISIPQIVVPDCLRALVQIASQLRNSFAGPVFAVTGSAGKSSTKEALAKIMGEHTLVSPASFNNLLGVSKTLFLVQDTTQRLILEMGMNALFEIKEMCENFIPTGGLITNIGDAHIGRLGGREGIYQAKKELFDFLAGSGAKAGVALNLDDPLVGKAFQESFGGRALNVTYSAQPGVKADVRTIEKKMDPKTGFLRLRLLVLGTELDLNLPIYGLHHAQNISAAIAAGVLMGADRPSIAERLAGFQPASHRGHLHQLGGDRILVDESYNSNPSALLSSLQSCAELDSAKNKVFVLGEMREMGQFSQALHEQLGVAFSSLFSGGRFTLIGVGDDMKFLLNKVGKQPSGQVLFAANAIEASVLARSHFVPGSVCLVKGSRGVQLDKVVQDLSDSFAVSE